MMLCENFMIYQSRRITARNSVYTPNKLMWFVVRCVAHEMCFTLPISNKYTPQWLNGYVLQDRVSITIWDKKFINLFSPSYWLLGPLVILCGYRSLLFLRRSSQGFKLTISVDINNSRKFSLIFQKGSLKIYLNLQCPWK